MMQFTNYNAILDIILKEVTPIPDKGRVATYIPELGTVDPTKFGVHLRLLNGDSHGCGDYQEPFSVQSISKVLSLSQALSILGDKLWERVDVEPSGHPFNQLALLEVEKGIPRNPLINAGAIVIADILISNLKNPKADYLNYIQGLANDNTISFNAKVAESEKNTGFKNYATANLLKSFGNLNNDVDEVLDFYFFQSSLEMSCQQLTKTFYAFANQGVCGLDKIRLTKLQTKRINAIMLSCGFYDEAGEFAFRVGLPGKSGVGGGIVAVLPGEYVISTWSPGLNPKGNSTLGMKALELFTTYSKESIF